MDYNELKNMWENYDQKLDRIEVSNQKILEYLISRKSNRKIQLISLQSLVGIITTPLILGFVLFPIALNNSLKTSTAIGLLIVAVLFLASFIVGIIFFAQSRSIKPELDSVIKTKEKLLKLQTFGINVHKIRNFAFPLIATSFILIFWNQLNYSVETKIIIFGLVVIAQFFWGKYKFKMYFSDRMKLLQKEMEELSQYKD